MSTSALNLLFTFAGGIGHCEPLLPIGRAAAAAGHAVRFAAPAAMVPAIEAAGFAAIAMGKSAGGGAPKRIPLRPLSAEREDRDLRDNFADRLARQRAADLLGLCDARRPDLVICDEVDFGAMIAAERLAIPHASVVVIAAGSFVRPELVAEPLHRLRREHGLPPDPELAMLSRYLVLSPVPASFRDPAFPLPVTGHAIRPFDQLAKVAAPAWIAELSGAPTVYFTLGTVFNVESGDLFSRVLAALRALPVNVVATVGHQIDPAELGPQTANVRIKRYVAQASILPHCDVVVSHGGSGSVLGALAHGLPSLLIPMGADQPLNAARCVALGVGRSLDALTASQEEVSAAVAALLADAGCRRAAERLRDEIASLPEPAQAVRLLERLAAERRPLGA